MKDQTEGRWELSKARKSLKQFWLFSPYLQLDSISDFLIADLDPFLINRSIV